jgi:hypothetical protein
MIVALDVLSLKVTGNLRGRLMYSQIHAWAISLFVAVKHLDVDHCAFNAS